MRGKRAKEIYRQANKIATTNGVKWLNCVIKNKKAKNYGTVEKPFVIHVATLQLFKGNKDAPECGRATYQRLKKEHIQGDGSHATHSSN